MKSAEKVAVQAIRDAIVESNDVAIAALLKIYANQTATERAIGATLDDNGVGFSGADAEFATSLCEQYNRRGRLSDKQWPYVVRIARKYAGQIYKMSFTECVE